MQTNKTNKKVLKLCPRNWKGDEEKWEQCRQQHETKCRASRSTDHLQDKRSETELLIPDMKQRIENHEEERGYDSCRYTASDSGDHRQQSRAQEIEKRTGIVSLSVSTAFFTPEPCHRHSRPPSSNGQKGSGRPKDGRTFFGWCQLTPRLRALNPTPSERRWLTSGVSGPLGFFILFF